MLDKIIHNSLNLPYRLNINIIRQVKGARATVVLLHGLASSHHLWSDFYDQLPKDITVVSVDLLGHGVSPRPTWGGAQTLNMQARSLYRSLRYTRFMSRPVFIIGHSLGALVAVEFARLYPKRVDYLVLVSPPVYVGDEAPPTIRERLLKMNYNFLITNQDFSSKITEIATDKFIKGAKTVRNEEDFRPLVESLEKSILEQNTFESLNNLSTDTKIIYGLFDPLVIGENIRKIKNKNVKAKLIPSAHEISKVAASHIKKEIKTYLRRSQNV